jgi:hypothetical protein
MARSTGSFDAHRTSRGRRAAECVMMLSGLALALVPALYAAYLLENVLPGEPDEPPKSAARMLATEGVVSALFFRWATDASLRNAYRGPSFYEQFGTKRIDVSPAENIYLKMIYAFALGKPRDARAAIACVIVLPVVWLAGSPPLVAFLVPVLVFGVPGALWRRRTRGTIAAGAPVLAAWAAAAVPASLLVMPLF